MMSWFPRSDRATRESRELERQLQEARIEKEEALERSYRATRESRELERQLQEARIEKEEALTRCNRATHESRELERQLQEARQCVEKLKAEKQEAFTRLCEVVSHQMRDNNPNIVDFNDVYRPDKLAELSNFIYDNQWFDAYDHLKDEGIADEECENILLDLLMRCYSFCSELAKEHMDLLKEWYIPTLDDPSIMEIQTVLKKGRKRKALDMLPGVEKKCISQLKHEVGPEKIAYLSKVQIYIRACVKLCWLMTMPDPPVVMVCPGWKATMTEESAPASHQVDITSGAAPTIDNGPCGITNGSSPTQNVIGGYKQIDTDPNDEVGININEYKVILDRHFFNEYTQRGKYIKYIVWPCMLLHEGGLTLNRGVAQGYD